MSRVSIRSNQLLIPWSSSLSCRVGARHRGGANSGVIELNEQAATRLRSEHRLEIVPRGTHLFEEPDALDQVAELAGD
jgi:hypothetical protein